LINKIFATEENEPLIDTPEPKPSLQTDPLELNDEILLTEDSDAVLEGEAAVKEAFEKETDVFQQDIANENKQSEKTFKKPPPGPPTNTVRLVDKTIQSRIKAISKSVDGQKKHEENNSKCQEKVSVFQKPEMELAEKSKVMSDVQNQPLDKTRNRNKSGPCQKKNIEYQQKNKKCQEMEQESQKLGVELTDKSLPQIPSPKITRTRSKSGPSDSTCKELFEDVQREPTPLNLSPKQSKSKIKSASVSMNPSLQKTKRKSKRKNFKCHVCKKGYSGPGALHNHIQHKHMGIVYSCKFCDYKSGQAGTLKIHLKKHST